MRGPGWKKKAIFPDLTVTSGPSFVPGRLRRRARDGGCGTHQHRTSLSSGSSFTLSPSDLFKHRPNQVISCLKLEFPTHFSFLTAASKALHHLVPAHFSSLAPASQAYEPDHTSYTNDLVSLKTGEAVCYSSGLAYSLPEA